MEVIGMLAICDIVKMSPTTVLSWIREAEFPATKIRGKGIWISDTDEIQIWLRRRAARGIAGNAAAALQSAEKPRRSKGR